MHKPIYELWYLNWLFRRFRVIPIAPGASKEALQHIRQLLNAGEPVCLFPEGSLSRDGRISRFRRGYQQAVEGTDAPIIPFFLRGLWGSRFSRARDERAKKVKPLGKREISIRFGEALDNAIEANELQRIVEQLGTADTAAPPSTASRQAMTSRPASNCACQ